MKSISAIKKALLAGISEITPIDQEILDLVIGLNAFGLVTHNSCAGHPDRSWSFPYVDIYEDFSHIDFSDFSDKSAQQKKELISKNIDLQKKLLPLLEEFYLHRKVAYRYQITPHTVIDWAGIRLKCAGADLLQSMPVKTFIRELPKYQQEMTKFGEFLLKKYQGG